MAKKLYTEAGGVSHKVKKLYTEVGGVSHKVKKLYAEVNGISKLVFSAVQPPVFTKYEQIDSSFYGYYSLTPGANSMLAKISGYTAGENRACTVGWMIENLPPGADVEITYEWYKGGFQMNDIIFSSANGILEIRSDNGVVYTNTLKTTNHTGWILGYVNFFPASYYQTTSWLDIKRVVVDGDQAWP